MLSIATAFILSNIEATKKEAREETSLLAENLSDIVNISQNWQQTIKGMTESRTIIGEAELTNANSSSVPVISSSLDKTYTLTEGGFFQSAARVSQGDYLKNGKKINTEVLRADLKANFESHYNIADDIIYSVVPKYSNMGIYGLGTHPFITRAASILAQSFADTTDALELTTQIKAIAHDYVSGLNADVTVKGILNPTVEFRMNPDTLNILSTTMSASTDQALNDISAYEYLVKYFAKQPAFSVKFTPDTGLSMMPLVLKAGTYKTMIIGLIEKRYISYENPFAAHLIGGKNAISKDLTGNNVTATFTSMQLGLDVKRKNTVEVWEV